jgi:C1A family cysteine protease
MDKPSRMSMPSAAAFPISKLGFSNAAKARLLKNGIVSALQLAEIASRTPRQLKHLTGLTPTKAIRVLEAEFGPLPDFTNVATSHGPLPSLGVPDGLPSPKDALKAGPSSVRLSLTNRLEEITDLPASVSLVDHMPPVGNQGPYGTCVGWSASAVREFALRQPMSAGYAYRGAKSRDGYPNVEGSWLRFAMEHFFQTGHVDEEAYSYRDAVRDAPIEPFAPAAARARSLGFASLIAPSWAARKLKQPYLPKLLKALLTGALTPRLGPQPVAVSVTLYQSFASTSTALDGLIPMPFPGEARRGGHAMAVVGYMDKHAPENPFGLNYFIVRNSWGTRWASENPFGYAGHACVPEMYFTDLSHIREAYVCLGPC